MVERKKNNIIKVNHSLTSPKLQQSLTLGSTEAHSLIPISSAEMWKTIISQANFLGKTFKESLCLHKET